MTGFVTMITKLRRTRRPFVVLRDLRTIVVFVFMPLPVAAALLLASSLAAQAPEQDRAQAEALSKRAAERLAALQKESEALVKQEQTLLVELRKLEVERQIKVEELAGIEREVASVQQQLQRATERAQALKSDAQRQEPDLERRLVQLYKMGRVGYWRMLLDVSDVRDLGRAYRTASALNRIDRDRVEEHKRTLAALSQERAVLEKRSRELQVLQTRGREARAAVDRAVAAHSTLVASIDARRDLNARLTGELEEAQSRLQSSIHQMAAGKSVPALGLPLAPFRGALPWPADGVLTQRFGRTDRNGIIMLRNGIELSLAENRPVHAVHEGTVAFADQFSGYANLVIVDHGERNYSLYGHLNSLSVRKGDRVDASTVVGLTGRNPAGNPSLYFELRIDGKAVDPLQWLKRP
jgi:septal ring factor EnvC (AmiA/AmiB activator)